MSSTRSPAAWRAPLLPTVRPGRTSAARCGSMGTRPELRTSAEPPRLRSVRAVAREAEALAVYRCRMAAGEDNVTVVLDAELVERARTELGFVSESDRAVVERVLDAYLLGR